MHFPQILHQNHFILSTDHKPLEWLATMLDAYGRRGRWIDMLQDFNFKILHRLGSKHSNVDALSRNLVGGTKKDEDFFEEIQDVKLL
jgi:hypothetical protein